MPQDMVGPVVRTRERPDAQGVGGPAGPEGDVQPGVAEAVEGARAREALSDAGPVLDAAAEQVAGPVTDEDRARALVAAFSDDDVVLDVDAEGLGAYVARLKADDASLGSVIQAEVDRLLPAAERPAYRAAVEDNAPGLLDRAWGAVTDAGEWVTSRPGAFREWHDGYQPESFLGHVGDGIATVGVGLLDVAEFGVDVAGAAIDNSQLGRSVDDIRRVWGDQVPSWLPSQERGRETLQGAADTVVALASDPKLIWDGLTDNYAKLWAEERYGGLVGQVVADFGDVLLGSKGAGRTAGALSDLSRAGQLSKLDTVTDVLTAARRADAVAPGEFVRIADEMAVLKRADGSLGQMVDAARRTDTLPDLLGRGILTRTDVDDLIRSGDLTLDEAARARLPTSGARYVDEISTPEEIAAYDAIAARAGDVEAIARNTGIDPAVVERVREHLFIEEHEIALGPDRTARGNFSPMEEVADPWNAAVSGALQGDELAAFKRLMAHEYVESRLMQEGLPFRSAHPDAYALADDVNLPTPEHFGAHDLAPIGDHGKGPWHIYEGLLDKTAPTLPIADDLSNLDAVVAQILESIR